ncbi:hypothetical protein ACFQJ8_12545 [Halocatena marina]|uniref:hypothetical protein n=1 Tax=Halocatena marina TaxID=2934937 RepID=UPI00360BEA27
MTSARATGTERLERQPRQIDPLTADKSAAELDDHHVHRYTSSRRYLIAEGVDSLDQTGAGRYDVICTPFRTTTETARRFTCRCVCTTPGTGGKKRRIDRAQ